MRSPDTAPVLEVRSVTKSFGRRPGLVDVSFVVEGPAVVAVTGGNGAGKSTLLRCLAGIARCDGDVLLGGRSVRSVDARRDLAYLPQQVGLPPAASVGEVLDLFARLRSTTADDHPLPDGFLPDLDALVGTLSGGQSRRVAITAALMGRPRLLLLDEPDASLDDAGQLALERTLAALHDGGSTILIATPASGALASAAERRIVLDDGRKVEDTTIGAPMPDRTRQELRCAP